MPQGVLCLAGSETRVMAVDHGSYSVRKKAISARLSSASKSRPKSCPTIARVLTPGDYVLTLRTAAIDDRELARYSFVVR